MPELLPLIMLLVVKAVSQYLQLNIQNRSAGNSASSDVVATADNGNESVNYVDLGINPALTMLLHLTLRRPMMRTCTVPVMILP